MVQGRKQRFITNATVGDYRFNGWYENNTIISTNTTLDITAGANDRTIEARYDFYPTYTVTFVNRNNGGQTTTSQVLSGNYWSSSTNEEVGDYLFVRWLKDGSQVSTSTSYGFYVSDNTTITCEYRPKETYHLTVVNGTGSGDYKERQSVNISADTSLGDFSDWVTSGNIYSISNSYSANTTVKLGRGDGTVTANYNMRKITVITNSGTNIYNVRQDAYINVSSGIAPSTYEFNSWSRTSGDAIIANPNSSSTRITAGTSDSVITCNYTPIPRFTVTVQNGQIQDMNGTWTATGVVLRDGTNSLKLNQGAVPNGYQFLRWDVYVNGVLQTNNDLVEVYQPLAETTRLAKIRSDCTINAVFYIPDPEVVYTLTIQRWDGSTDQPQAQYPAGANVNIYASTPPTGKEFYKWEGDTAYVTGVYSSNATILMPAMNITVIERFEDEGYIPEYGLARLGAYGEMCYITTHVDPQTGDIIEQENWTTNRTEYRAGTEVKIRVTSWDADRYFGSWHAYNHDTGDSIDSIFDEITSPNTFLTMPAYEVDFEASVPLKSTYRLTLEDGYTGVNNTSVEAYEGKKVDIRFAKESTENIHYEFIRWIGLNGTIVSNIELWDGGMFNPLIPGTEINPIYIKMPGYAIGLKATYNAYYKVSLTGATIDETGETSGYYENGDIIHITADTISGMTFQYWEGNTERLGNIYDPTTTLTMTTGIATISAVYSTDNERNDIGYTTLSLQTETTVNSSAIIIISGTLQVGFILTDSLGHVYVVTAISGGDCTIVRLTKTYQGGDIYG